MVWSGFEKAYPGLSVLVGTCTTRTYTQQHQVQNNEAYCGNTIPRRDDKERKHIFYWIPNLGAAMWGVIVSDQNV